MKKWYPLIFAAGLAFHGWISAHASGQRAPEQSAIMDVIGAMKVFEHIHPGQTATNWVQISEVLNLEKLNQSLLKNNSGRLDENYVFIQQKIPIPENQKGEVLLIRISPTFHGETNATEGRYIISRHESGLKFNWLSEANVQKMLADAGVTVLPKPELLSQVTNTSETVPVLITSNRVANPTTPGEPVYSTPTPEPRVVEPAPPVAVASQPASQPAPPVESSSLGKPLLIGSVAILGLVAAFVLLRPRK